MPLTPAFAAKAALIRQVRRQGTTQEELTRRMGSRDWEAVDILRPNMASPMSRITLALQTTGRRLVLEDLPEEPGEHFHEPAGQTPMDDLNQSQGGNYILQRWQRSGSFHHQCVGSGL